MNVFDLFNLKGQVALVTGGSIGLGEQMCTAMAEAGASVVIAARKIERCEAMADKLRKLGAKALAVRCEVSQPAEVEAMVDRTIQAFGRIDILINNAGITWGAPAEDYPLERWQKVLDVNLTGTFLCAQSAARIMIKQNYGKIINVGSVCGYVGTDPQVMNAIAYQASKGGIIAITKDLAAKWACHNINVNAIAPGWFPTHLTETTLRDKNAGLLAHIPMKRFGGEDELKGAVLYLASKASNYVTGHVLNVDGGYLAI